MPVVDIQVVTDAEHTVPAGSAKAVATAMATVLHAPSGHVWVRLEHLPVEQYAENGPVEVLFPVFVKVLLADLPPPDALATQAASLAQAVATCLNRRAEQVHIEYAPAGRGRVAFGGQLVR
ncbi:MAG: hypothetical protein OEU89_07045 [Burkholderiaceae bacterium]|jgi:phenylpyruvate tautomerase PptA (4-oxalocrotonate tautomerase family)|nr:hypothetical protein [Burkholderiaceae bacterium]MDH5285597.1 hypothetical protein [Betaproteobacteria bacterium]